MKRSMCSLGGLESVTLVKNYGQLAGIKKNVTPCIETYFSHNMIVHVASITEVKEQLRHRKLGEYITVRSFAD